MLLVLRTLALAVLLLPASATAQQPQRLNAPDVSPGVFGVLATPKTPGPHPAVILLYGSSGWNATYPALAARAAESGFVALALDYYAETGPAPARAKDRPAKWTRWQESVRNAATYLRSLPVVSGKPIGLVGYSLGPAWPSPSPPRKPD